MDTESTPRHIGFILDGNRRWAKDNNLPKMEGHRIGFENLKTIVEAAHDRGVEVVSAYIFSTENWNRAKEEVSYLMDLAFKMMTRDLKETFDKGVRVVWIGSEDGVSKKLVKAIRDAEERTKDNTKGILALCFNYGGKLEITDAVKKLLAENADPAQLTPEDIEQKLYAPEIPPIDLMVRTSGEQRLSNFMLWRVAYSELLFIDKHWPAFNVDDLDAVIAEYKSRQRRYGA